MDEMQAPRKSGFKRRATLWAVFGVVGVVMGAAFATGFAQTSNTSSDANKGDATQLVGTPSKANASQFAGYVTAPTDALALTYDGNYGLIPADTVLFDINIPANDPYGHAYGGSARFYSDVILSNWTELGMDPTSGTAQWDTLEFQWKIETCSGGTVADDFAAASSTPQMHVDRVDAHVTFSGLTAGTEYCVGLSKADATSESAALETATTQGYITGTVLFRSDATVATATNPTAPQFAATISRSA